MSKKGDTTIHMFVAGTTTLMGARIRPCPKCGNELLLHIERADGQLISCTCGASESVSGLGPFDLLLAVARWNGRKEESK